MAGCRMKKIMLVCAVLLLGGCAAGNAPRDAAQQSRPVSGAEKQLLDAHPAEYYRYALSFWGQGKRDEAVFWFYVGQLRYRFYLSVNGAGGEESALFAALQNSVGEPINLYAGADPDKFVRQVDEVLAWDAKNPNGFTSKTKYAEQWKTTRAGLTRFRDYTLSNREQMRADREQNGIGEIGVIDGVHVEERREKMPKDWPALVDGTSLKSIAGRYKEAGIFFRGSDQAKALSAKEFAVTVAGPAALTVVALRDGQELARTTVAVSSIAGAVVFERSRTLEQAELTEGVDRETVSLRKNVEGELILQRDILTEGKSTKGVPIRYSYTFWNRVQPLAR